jgi:hypothetical protein
MARASYARAVACSVGERARPADQSAEVSLTWSLSKIRIASLVLLAAALPAVACFSLTVPFVKWLSLSWLAGIAVLMHGLSRRAATEGAVLSVGPLGILDHRLMPRHIAWHEIAAISPVDPSRSHVVEIKLRWPKSTLAGTRWPVRIGAYCQLGCGIPAVTVNVMLLEGNVCNVLEAVAQYRPDLLHHTNRRALAAHQ